jgi:tRNA threonylcarbamoyl adenosine modification protein (Sua5/YciO/YrdC/YwlC family)
MEIIDIQKRKNINTTIEKCLRILNDEGVIVYPTDTIYGIGCDIYSEKALNKIYEIKKRNKKQPYIILISSLKMLDEFVVMNENSMKLIKKFWPGPLTIMFKTSKKINKFITGDRDKIAIRMPDNEFCLNLIERYAKPITSTSANLSGGKQEKFGRIVERFESNIDLYIYNGELTKTLPSTVVDLSENKINIIREGIIPLEKMV